MDTKQTFYFNHGVIPTHDTKLFGIQIIHRGTIQTPVEVENVPKNAQFLFATDKLDCTEAKQSNIIIREILNRHELQKGGLVSKYAYFRIV